MNSNILHVNDMAADNSPGVKQTAQSGQDLANVAFKLQQLVSKF